jgi:hypothetical protein
MGTLKPMPLARAYEFAAANDLKAEADGIRRGTQVDPGFRKGSQVRKARILDLFESHNLLGAFFAAHWPFGATDEGRERRDSYNRDRERNEGLLAADPPVDGGSNTGENPEEEEQEFPLEADLRDYLAHNLSVIEPGLRLYREGERTGIEFPIDSGHGRIDVLALDARETPVVIELKLSRGRNQTIGQLLYYMGWIDQHLGKGRSRGIIVAKEIPEDLVVAAQRLPEVALFRYKIAMTADLVKPSATGPEA